MLVWSKGIKVGRLNKINHHLGKGISLIERAVKRIKGRVGGGH